MHSYRPYPAILILSCDKIKEDALLDAEYASILASAEEGQVLDFTEEDGLLWYTPDPGIEPRLYIPDGQVRTHLIQEAHDAPSGGHLGVHKTHESLLRYCYWPHTFRTVHHYVRSCMQCLRNKQWDTSDFKNQKTSKLDLSAQQRQLFGSIA